MFSRCAHFQWCLGSGDMNGILNRISRDSFDFMGMRAKSGFGELVSVPSLSGLSGPVVPASPCSLL